jgi:glycine/D-amino acid oxidase-like deaminating enzyme
MADEAAGVADYVILGGGVLGTTLAAQASLAGHRVLVVRLSDRDRPRADSLRNQGWLQSGILYRPKDFKTERECREVAARTRLWGRQLLRECGLLDGGRGAVLRVAASQNRSLDGEIEDLMGRAAALRLPESDFFRLDRSEVEARVGAFAEEGSVYFNIPDAPFDEAGVIRVLRQKAVSTGAVFLDLPSPPTLRRDGPRITIEHGSLRIVTTLAVVAAGAASIDVLSRLGHALDGYLRQTPLLVHEAPHDLRVPLLVDRKFSVVRHAATNRAPDGALVIGTVHRRDNAPFVPAHARRILPDEVEAFRSFLPPELCGSVDTGRFTAGVELIPPRNRSFLDHWVEDFGPIVFASPGRATLAWDAAIKALALIAPKVAERPTCRWEGIADPWTSDVHMHFSDHYTFDDR